MKSRAIKIVKVLVAPLVIGLLLGFGVSTANAVSSSVVKYGSTGTDCYKHQAFTSNAGTTRTGSIAQWNYGVLCGSSSNNYLGNSAYIKKTNGSSCSTASLLYSSGKVSSFSRVAHYTKAACGTGQFQGGGTSKGYNGSGYLSGSIAAPYAPF